MASRDLPVSARAKVSRAASWLGPAVILAAATAILVPALFGSDPIYGFDTVQEKFFWRSWAYGRVAHGEWPWWCSGLVGGFPLIAEPIVQFWYPPVAILHAWLSPVRALNFTWWVHLTWAGTGMFLLLRDRRLASSAATLGGLAYGVAGWTVGHVPMGGIPHLATCAWAPWVLRHGLRLFERDGSPGSRDVAQTALVVALSILAGHAQFLYGALLFLALFVAANGNWAKPRAARSGARRSPRWASIAALGIAGGLAVTLAGIVVVPYAEFLAASNRGTSLPGDFSAFGARLIPAQLLGLIAPDFFGGRDGSPYWGFPTQEAVTPYFGVISLALALSPAPRRVRREAWVLRGLLLLGLVLALGPSTPVHAWFRHAAPLFGRARHPARWLVLSVLAGAWLAGWGAQALLEASGASERRSRLAQARAASQTRTAGLGLALVCLLSLAGAWTLSSSTVGEARFASLVRSVIEESSVPEDHPLRAASPAALRAARDRAGHALARAFAYTTVALTLVGVARAAREGRALGWVLVGLTTLDLVSWGRGYIVAFPRQHLAWPPEIALVVGSSDGSTRVATTIPGASFPFPAEFGSQHRILSRIGQADMHRGLLTGRGEAQAGIPTTPARWLELALGHRAYDFNDAAIGPRPVLDLLAVEHLLTAPGERPTGRGWARVASSPSAWIWRNAEVVPRAILIHRCLPAPDLARLAERLRAPDASPGSRAFVEGGCPAGIEPASPDQLRAERVRWLVAKDERAELEVDAVTGALLRLADDDLPGWSATVDGRPARVLHVDLALRGVVVPPGTHIVEFRYRPTSAYLGVAATACGTTMLVLLLLLAPSRPSRSRETARRRDDLSDGSYR